MKWTSLNLLVFMRFVVLFISYTHSHAYPDGSLSIIGGAIIDYTEVYVSDIPYTRSRKTGTLTSAPIDFFRTTFAYFDNFAANKYCYLIPVNRGRLYLVEAYFYPGAVLSGIPLASNFDLFINGNKWTKVNLKKVDNLHEMLNYETIFTAKSGDISLCLARNSLTEKEKYVFISVIKLRRLSSTLYTSIDFKNKGLDLLQRGRFGYEGSGDGHIYFPEDAFDRVWIPASSSSDVISINTEETNFGKGLANQPPLPALQTAITTQKVEDLLFSYPLSSANESGSFYFALYFCNIFERSPSFNISFQFSINDHLITDWLKFTSFSQCLVVQKSLQLAGIGSINMRLHPQKGSEAGPFINAAESFQIKDVQNMTHPDDVIAIRKIASSINVPDDWFGGDPCLPAGHPCTGIVCNKVNPSRVITINLTNFGLTGNIPPILAELTALTHLLLGSNNLSGSIPDLSSLRNLTTLQLQNNGLTGAIPRTLAKLPMLNQLYLENNKLDATVPPGLNKRGLDLRVTSQAVDKSNTTKYWIVACSVGALVMAVLLVTFLWKYKYRPPAHVRGSAGDVDLTVSNKSHTRQYHRLAVEYTEEEIKAATNGYSKQIGGGGFGQVFFGTLSGYDVAVKILSSTSKQGQAEFETEVNLLSRLYHKNLVNLIGYSKLPVVTLVYEYMHCGTLKDHLYGTPELKKSLGWNTRLNIALQAAEGLLYLHQCCNPIIIHRDIKCTNILLDERMNARVADFGLAKLLDCSKTHASASIKGTLGYLDPEYFETSTLTEKSDVYSFGVVLLEIISGTPPSENIVALARELISCGRIAELMDSSLDGSYKLSSAWKVAEVAYACVAPKSIDRLTMRMVLKELEEAVTFEFQDSTQYERISSRSFHESDMPKAR